MQKIPIKLDVWYSTKKNHQGFFHAKNPHQHRQQSSSQLGAGFDVETFNQDYTQREL